MIKITYWKESQGFPKEEIMQEEYFMAADNAGLRLNSLVNFTIGDICYSFKTAIYPDEIIHMDKPMSEEELEAAKERWRAAYIASPYKYTYSQNISSELIEDSAIDLECFFFPTRWQRIRRWVAARRIGMARRVYRWLAGRPVPEYPEEYEESYCPHCDGDDY